MGENHGTRERPSACGWLTAGWRRQAGGVAEAWFMRSVGSRAGVPALNLALPQTSLPWRSTVPTVRRSREGRDVLNSNLSSPLSTDRPLQHTGIM